MAFPLILTSSSLLRFLLTFSTSLPSSLQSRIELSTPITSYIRLKEGLYLSTQLAQDPYAGGSFHHPPLLLLLAPVLESRWAEWALWTAVDLGTAWLVGRIVDKVRRRKSKELGWSRDAVVALCLFHPFSIATSLSRSTIVFSNFFLALAIDSALSGALLPLAFSLSLATHFSLYPILLLTPLILLTTNSRQDLTSNIITAVVGFGIHQSIVLYLSSILNDGNWGFLQGVYGTILSIPDLTPTIGLSWYFFIEMFDHFRSFFVGVFQLHVLIYVVPLTIAFRKDPLFAVLMLVGIIGIFKSYPEFGDFTLWHTLLVGSYGELIPYLSHPYLLFSLTLYSIFLLPTFHHLWLYSGSGNANFFYASTLVWTLSQGMLLIDFLRAKGRKEVLDGLGEEGREKVEGGGWWLGQS